MKTYRQFLKEKIASDGNVHILKKFSVEEGIFMYQKMLDKMAAEQKARFIHLKNADFKYVVRKLQKYTAVYNSEWGSVTSIHAFIDNETGALLKPAGFKRPAKHPRGYVTDPTFMSELASRIDPYGSYLYMR